MARGLTGNQWAGGEQLFLLHHLLFLGLVCFLPPLIFFQNLFFNYLADTISTHNFFIFTFPILSLFPLGAGANMQLCGAEVQASVKLTPS